MIYTSYFNKRNKGEGKMIAICSTLPYWLDAKDFTHAPYVAPTKALRDKYKSRVISDTEFMTSYFKELNQESIIKLLQEIPKDRDCYLLCHEADGNKCHRMILRLILNKLGYKCEEF